MTVHMSLLSAFELNRWPFEYNIDSTMLTKKADVDCLGCFLFSSLRSRLPVTGVQEPLCDRRGTTADICDNMLPSLMVIG